MTEKAVVLQNYNQELVKYIELLKRRKQKIELEISQDERNKEILSAQIRALQEKQGEINDQMTRKKMAYAKIVDTLGKTQLAICFQNSKHKCIKIHKIQ